MIEINRLCPVTSKYNVMQLPLTDREYNVGMNKWSAGALIQVAFPTLNADHREFIKTGITPEVWEMLFGEDV